MINIYENFASEYSVIFNANKTVCLMFGQVSPNGTRQVSLGGTCLPWSDNVKYLGNMLSSNMDENLDIKKKQGDFIAAVNKVNSQFATVPFHIKSRLLQ